MHRRARPTQPPRGSEEQSRALVGIPLAKQFHGLEINFSGACSALGHHACDANSAASCPPRPTSRPRVPDFNGSKT